MRLCFLREDQSYKLISENICKVFVIGVCFLKQHFNIIFVFQEVVQCHSKFSEHLEILTLYYLRIAVIASDDVEEQLNQETLVEFINRFLSDPAYQCFIKSRCTQRINLINKKKQATPPRINFRIEICAVLKVPK